jgi:hypothetical protein
MDLISLFKENNFEEIKSYLKNCQQNTHQIINLIDIAFYLDKIESTDTFNEISELFFNQLDIQANHDTTLFLAQNQLNQVYNFYMNHTNAKELWLIDIIKNNQLDDIFPYIASGFVDEKIKDSIEFIRQSLYPDTSFDTIQKQILALNFNQEGNKTLSYSENKYYFFIYLMTNQNLILPQELIHSLNNSVNLFNQNHLNEITNKIGQLTQQYHFKSIQIDKNLNALDALEKLENNIACVKQFFNLKDEEVGEDLLSFTIHQNDTYLGTNHIHDDKTSGVYALQAKAMLSSPAQRASTFLHEYTHFRQNLAFENVEEFKYQFNDVYDTLKNYKNNQEEVLQLIIDCVKDKLQSTQSIAYLIHRMLNENLEFNQIEVQLNHIIQQEILPNFSESNVLFHIKTRLDSYHKNAEHSFETEFLHKLDNQNQASNLSYWERADEVHARMNEAAFDFYSHYHSMYEFTKSAFDMTRPKLFAFNQLLIENYRLLKEQINNQKNDASDNTLKNSFHL